MTKIVGPWLIALFGHSGSHAPQLMHSLVIIVAIQNPFDLITCFALGCQSTIVLASLEMFMLPIFVGRRTQVVKGEVCKTSMQRLESARRLQILTVFTASLLTLLLASAFDLQR